MKKRSSGDPPLPAHGLLLAAARAHQQPAPAPPAPAALPAAHAAHTIAAVAPATAPAAAAPAAAAPAHGAAQGVWSAPRGAPMGQRQGPPMGLERVARPAPVVIPSLRAAIAAPPAPAPAAAPVTQIEPIAAPAAAADSAQPSQWQASAVPITRPRADAIEDLSRLRFQRGQRIVEPPREGGTPAAASGITREVSNGPVAATARAAAAAAVIEPIAVPAAAAFAHPSRSLASPVPAAAAPALFTDDMLASAQDNYTGGQINQVDKLTYKMKVGANSNIGYFKASTADAAYLGDDATIIGATDRLAERALASSAIDDLLGLGVVARTARAQHSREPGALPLQGTVSEEAPGLPLIQDYVASERRKLKGKEKTELLDKLKERDGDTKLGKKDPSLRKYEKEKEKYFVTQYGQQYNEFDFTSPVIQKGLNDLQWEDALAGQVDRHGGNIFIDPETGKVTGIDNDAAFGSKKSDKPNDLGGHNLGLPSLIDQSTAARFRGVSPEVLSETLRAQGLNDQEIGATLIRLEAIKGKIDELEQKGLLVGADQEGKTASQFKAWGQGSFAHETKDRRAAKRSYLGRAVDLVKAARSDDAAKLAFPTRVTPAATGPQPAVPGPQQKEKEKKSIFSLFKK